MPFVPHNQTETNAMLATIGVDSIDALFDEIPAALRAKPMDNIPLGKSEMDVIRLMQSRAKQDRDQVNFIGAGCYAHHIPAAVWDLVGRGEFMTAYTPYQAEASQGGLQLIYEYQTMMASLMGMEVSNASMYEGASALAESALMAIRLNRKSKSKRILILSEIAPSYQQVLDTILTHQGIVFEHVAPAQLAEYEGQDIAAVIIPQPNFLGQLIATDQLTDWAHAQNALVIGVVNPVAMALIKPPGQWGEQGADIVCGEGQPLGVPMSSGGPFFGFMCCKQAYVRQMPGRIVGRSVDVDGKPGFCLTLQAREQHIRRSKATSNICTNQGLLVTAATIYMSLVGPEGLKQVAMKSVNNAKWLATALAEKGVTVLRTEHPQFHEFVIQLDQPVQPVLQAMSDRGIEAGYDLSHAFPELGNALLVCSTEVHHQEDLQRYVDTLMEVISC